MTSTTDHDTTTDTTTNGLSLVELAQREHFTMAWAPELEWSAVCWRRGGPRCHAVK